MTINDKIREDYGTLTHFCKKEKININTLRVVLCGYGVSRPIATLLKSKGFIKSFKELKRK